MHHTVSSVRAQTRRQFTRIVTAFAFLLVSLCVPVPAEDPPARRVAVTIDDLPVATRVHAEDTKTLEGITTRLLEHIKTHDIPAVGFVNEQKLYRDGELDPARVALLRLWVRAGLELGNHTFSHPDLHKTSLDEFKEDVIRGEPVTRGLLNEVDRKLRYFRHPYLHTGRDLETRAALEGFLVERGYTVAPVTVDNSEWLYAFAYEKALEAGDEETAKSIGASYVGYIERYFEFYERTSRDLLGYELPQILLLHANALNADYLAAVARAVTYRGYEFVPLEEALKDPAYESKDTFFGPGGISWLHRWALTRGKQGEFFHGEPEVPEFVSELAEGGY